MTDQKKIQQCEFCLASQVDPSCPGATFTQGSESLLIIRFAAQNGPLLTALRWDFSQ